MQALSYGTELASLVPQMEPEIDRDGVTYKFRWIDEIPATMPDNDLTINGEYVEKVDSNLVYYGYVLNAESGSTTPSTYATMPSYDASLENPKDVTITIPIDTAMLELAEKLATAEPDTEEEMEEYQKMEEEFNRMIEANRYRLWLRIPSQYSLGSVIDSLGYEMLFEKLTDRNEINNDTDYDLYRFIGVSDTMFVRETEDSWSLKITLE